MPGWLVGVYAGELTRLKAAEALEQVSIIAVGTATGKKEDRRRAVSKWQASQGERKRARRELSHEQINAITSAKGIEVEWQNH